MEKEMVVKYLKTNKPLFYKNQKVFVIELFEEFNLVEILNEDYSSSILADINFLSQKEKEEEKAINIFRGGI